MFFEDNCKVNIGIMMNNIRIAVVVVTYNRLDYLKKSLDLYINQSYKPQRIIVVDNCSSDGTVDYLHEWASADEGIPKKVIYLDCNQGGSGGFYAGLEEAIKYDDVDWIWVADDDAFPSLEAFEKANDFIVNHQELISESSAICGVCRFDNHISSIQRSLLKKTVFGIQEFPIAEDYYSGKDYFEISLYSFVGTIMKKENLIKAGLPRKDFFLYQDDLEHAVRMGKTGKIYCVTSIIIEHRDNVAPKNETSWRDYYAARNLTVMYKEHFGNWSLFWRIVRRRLFALLTLNRYKIKLINVGIKDGKAGKMGLHKLYRPGWKM